MKITAGVNWIINPTTNFEQTVTFFRHVLGLPITAEGVPVTDVQFTRYAQITMPTGDVLEIVEPHADVQQLYTAPIISLTVDNIVEARRELEEQQSVFVSPIFRTDDNYGWSYFRAPDGNIYQLQGPCPE